MAAVIAFDDYRDLAAPTRTVTSEPQLVLVPDAIDDIEIDFDPGFLLQARAVANRHPHSLAAWGRLARAEIDSGNLEAAVEAALRALEPHGIDYDVPAAVVAAQVLAAAGELNRAEDALGRIDATFDGGAPAPVSLFYASLAARRGAYDKAIARLKNVDETEPNSAALRGWIALQQRDYSGAVRLLRHTSLEANPIVLLNLGYGFAALGSLKKALRATQTACQLAPADRTSAFNLASLYSMTGSPDRAFASLKRIQAHHPNDLKIDFALAEILSRSGRASAALSHLRSVRSRQQFFAGSTVDRAKLKANVAMLRRQLNEISAATALTEVVAALDEANFRSTAIARQIPMLAMRTTDASTVESVLVELRKRHEPDELLSLESHLDVLTFRYREATEKSLRWHELEPFSGHAVMEATFLLTVLWSDYEAASKIGRQGLKRMPADAFVANNLAFALALARKPGEARAVLPDEQSHPETAATYALIELVEGSVDESRAHYAKAATRVAEHNLAPVALVHCYEEFAKYRLGLGAKPDFSALPATLDNDLRAHVLRHAVENDTDKWST